MDIADITAQEGFGEIDTLGREFLVLPQAEGWLNVGELDLEGINMLQFQVIGSTNPGKFQVEVRKGGLDGEVLSNTIVDFNAGTFSLPLRPTEGEPAPIFVKVKPMEQPTGRALLEALKFIPEKQS